MRGKYRHVFFDLDHTLWDFERNSSEVLGHLYDEHIGEDAVIFSKEALIKQFRDTNNYLWSQYNTRSISKRELRDSRFSLVFKALGHQNDRLSTVFSSEYLQRCPQMPHIFPFVHEVLDYLKNEKQYVLHILTNGFEEVQHLKLNAANISKYFNSVITPDAAGCQKPEQEYFTYALTKAVCRCDESVMVGDNLETDIKGAKNAAIDQVFFNPERLKHRETMTYEISCLSELLTIL